jgi:hypothetical protein
MKKQKGETSLGHLAVLIILLIGVFIFTRYSRPELYDESNNFKGWKVEKNQVIVKIEGANWYDSSQSTSYYIFTDIGKLYVSNKGVFSFNETLYEELEEYIGYYCTLNVENLFLSGWSVRDFSYCQEDKYTIEQQYNQNEGVPVTVQIMIVPEFKEIINNEDVPQSTPVKTGNDDVPK